MNPILHDLQNKQWVWSATSVKQEEQQRRTSTGFSPLDKALSAGFPKAGMVHIGCQFGSGELRLLLDILNHQLDSDEQRFWVFISPPGKINAEFLLSKGIDIQRLLIIHKTSPEEALWSAEQCSKSGACAGVFIWQKKLSQLQVRKLEIAAQRGQAYCCWFDYSASQQHNLPLSLSLSLQRQGENIHISVNKQKVGWAKAPVKIPLPFRCKTSMRYKAHSDKPANVVNLHSSQ